ncbi:MAG: ABC transporter ATP-binding protein, partial [Verrucomicrobia subdivision 3 bacterium]|nr:ABC transporter ATP-binding protein [Limisphaerales bacterium]
QAAAETSGAQSGARVAAYLRGDAEAQPTAEKVWERLTLSQPVPAAVAPVEAVKPAVDEKKLEAMTKAAEPSPPPNQPVMPASKPEDLSKADEKLAALLGKKK